MFFINTINAYSKVNILTTKIILASGVTSNYFILRDACYKYNNIQINSAHCVVILLL